MIQRVVLQNHFQIQKAPPGTTLNLPYGSGLSDGYKMAQLYKHEPYEGHPTYEVLSLTDISPMEALGAIAELLKDQIEVSSQLVGNVRFVKALSALNDFGANEEKIVATAIRSDESLQRQLRSLQDLSSGVFKIKETLLPLMNRRRELSPPRIREHTAIFYRQSRTLYLVAYD